MKVVHTKEKLRRKLIGLNLVSIIIEPAIPEMYLIVFQDCKIRCTIACTILFIQDA